MPSIDNIAEEYAERAAALDPFYATYAGIAGHDDELPDLSADGFAERAELDRSTLAALEAAETPGLREQVARAAMQERLAVAVERYDAGDTTSELNVIDSWVQYVRELFDLMPTEGEESAANIARRMAAVPEAYRQFSRTLLDAARNGRPPARLQVEEVAKQCANWSNPEDSFYSGLVEQLTGVPDSLRGELDAAARAATAATAELGAFLSRELLPLAREKDACGPEVYARASRYFLGAAVDLQEAYAWSWEEIARLRAEQARVSNLIRPGATQEEAVAILDGDPARRIEGRENFRAWMQELAEHTISELNGKHFDIPEPARRIEAMIAPVNDGGIYYTAPSEDWSRPGRMWWSVPDGIDTFSTWKEITTVYHEGVPGHHLQISQTLAEQENLNRWQRLMCWVSGYGEGWATYAERLMGELGYLERPGGAPGDARHAADVRRQRGPGHRGAPGAGDPRGHRLAGGRALERRDRPGVPAGPLQLGRKAPALRVAPLPRLAGAGSVLQARRADLAAGQGRGQGPGRRRLQPQGLPHPGAQPGRHGPGPAARGPGPLLAGLS